MRSKRYRMPPRLLLLTTIIINITIEILALPQDYGRDYSMRENDTSVPLVFIILIGVVLWGGYKLLYLGVSKLDDSNKKRGNKPSSENNKINAQSGRSRYGTGTICPECNGKGYKKEKQIHCDGEYCEYCHGYGKEFSAVASQYYRDMLDESSKRRIELEKERHKQDRFHYSVLLYLDSQIASNSKNLLDAELANCNPCPYCNGKGKIMYDYFYETDERMNLVKYRKIFCNRCNGIGYIY